MSKAKMNNNQYQTRPRPRGSRLYLDMVRSRTIDCSLPQTSQSPGRVGEIFTSMTSFDHADVCSRRAVKGSKRPIHHPTLSIERILLEEWTLEWTGPPLSS
ncbi:hypothetical protein E8E14_013648 [Neopestalotiopsis sp. 37M]|nr:hypothetical protein E8E14_013648 [Neopestalotiopsis sp. 37M]